MSLLGLDIGTTGAKAIVFDTSANILAQTYQDYPLQHPRPDWAELDAHNLWQSVKTLISQVSTKVNQDPIEGICIASQGEGVVPIDKNGNILSNFVVAFDNRTYPQFCWWQEIMGSKAIYKITGMPLHPMYSVNKVMWFEKNMPKVHRKTWKYLCGEDFIGYNLTGETAIGFSLAARTMAFDVQSRQWSDEILSKARLDAGLFSQPVPAGTVVGKVRAEIADELSLSADVKVIAGGHDQACGALGAGIVKPGMAVNSTGTVDVLCPVLPSCLVNEKMLKGNYCCSPHTYPDTFRSIAVNLTGGLLLRWYRDVIAATEVQHAVEQGVDPYSYIIENAAADPADVFWLPHLVGAGTPTLQSQSRGAILGLTASTHRPELARAVLDSLNYEMKYNIECLQESGVDIRELRVIGGGARSSRWVQMKADVFGKQLSVLKHSEAAALGAAILAAVAQGHFSDANEAVEQMVVVTQEFSPDQTQEQLYQERYGIYRDVFSSLKDINRRIADLG